MEENELMNKIDSEEFIEFIKSVDTNEKEKWTI
jgi:hypothetical protein